MIPLPLDQDRDRNARKKICSIYARIERWSKILWSRSLGSKLNARNARSMIEIKTWFKKIESIFTFLDVRMWNIFAFDIFVQNVNKGFQIDCCICQKLEFQLYHARKMLGFARKMLGFARKIFLHLCSRSLGDRSKFCYARNARPFFRSRSLGSKIQNQKLCSRSLGSKISMLEMLEIDVFAARSQL